MALLKTAIIGAGTWGETHGTVYQHHPDVELKAVCDLQIERAKAFAAKFGVPEENVYTDYREMLNKADVDAVSIVTPDFTHTPIAIDCANAKKHLLIEKPLTTSCEEARQIIEAVRRNNVRMMVDLHNRFSPIYNVVKQNIDSGEIGELYSAYYRLNDIKWVATDLLPWAAKSSILWFLGYHSADLLRWMFNDEVARVYAVSRSGILQNLGIDTEDMYQTILEFRGGGIATMENGWITPNTGPMLTDTKLNITGTKGMFNIDPTNNGLLERFLEHPARRPDYMGRNFVHGEPKGFTFESIRHFVDCLISGKPFVITEEDAYNTTALIVAIKESAQRREPVEVAY